MRAGLEVVKTMQKGFVMAWQAGCSAQLVSCLKNTNKFKKHKNKKKQKISPTQHDG